MITKEWRNAIACEQRMRNRHRWRTKEVAALDEAEAYTYGYLQVWGSSVLYPRPRVRELSESGLSRSPGTEGLENNQE